MLKIGCKHTLDFEGFEKWHETHEKEHLNGAEQFINNKMYNKLFLVEIDEEDDSRDYGEIHYKFNIRNQIIEDNDYEHEIWFWNDSLKFFHPIDFIQEDFDV